MSSRSITETVITTIGGLVALGVGGLFLIVLFGFLGSEILHRWNEPQRQAQALAERRAGPDGDYIRKLIAEEKAALRRMDEGLATYFLPGSEQYGTLKAALVSGVPAMADAYLEFEAAPPVEVGTSDPNPDRSATCQRWDDVVHLMSQLPDDYLETVRRLEKVPDGIGLYLNTNSASQEACHYVPVEYRRHQNS